MYYYSYATAVPPPTKKPKAVTTTPIKKIQKRKPLPVVTTKASPPPPKTDPAGGSIPLVFMFGGAAGALISLLVGTKYQIIFLGASVAIAILGGYLYFSKIHVNNPFPGVWSWLQGYSIYGVAVGAIGLYLFRGIHTTAFGILGQLFFL
jgi:hypothetical protein